MQPQSNQQPAYTQINKTENPTQPLQADVVDKLITVEVKVFRNKLARFLHNAEEVEEETPIYEMRKQLMLDDTGRPMLDEENKPIFQERQVKIGSEKRSRFKALYDSDTKPMLNERGTREIIGLVEMSCNPFTRASYIQNRDLIETGKNIAQKMTNQVIIRYKEYDYELSPIKSMTMFEGLAILICSFISPSTDGAMLTVIQNTHQFGGNLNQPIPKTEGILDKLKRMVT